jgi:L-lactate dehydrogenase complex protein LldE
MTAMATGLLGCVDGLDVRRLAHEDECCGFGGTFSVKLPEVASGMVQRKLDDVRETGARIAVSGDLSCLVHIQSAAGEPGAPLETWTIAELLSRALE